MLIITFKFDYLIGISSILFDTFFKSIDLSSIKILIGYLIWAENLSHREIKTFQRDLINKCTVIRICTFLLSFVLGEYLSVQMWIEGSLSCGTWPSFYWIPLDLSSLMCVAITEHLSEEWQGQQEHVYCAPSTGFFFHFNYIYIYIL